MILLHSLVCHQSRPGTSCHDLTNSFTPSSVHEMMSSKSPSPRMTYYPRGRAWWIPGAISLASKQTKHSLQLFEGLLGRRLSFLKNMEWCGLSTQSSNTASIATYYFYCFLFHFHYHYFHQHHHYYFNINHHNYHLLLVVLLLTIKTASITHIDLTFSRVLLFY